MPLIPVPDKKKILGLKEVQAPKPKVFDSAQGVPLFWAERKSVEFWKTLFTDLGALQVVDVSPGTGMAARAALDLGLHYLGVARNSLHTGWLNIVVDRAALTAIRTKNTAIYNSQLAEEVQEHFKEWLDGTSQADKAADTSAGDEKGFVDLDPM